MKSTITDNQKVWFITGASTGLGPFLVKQALEKGDRVVATFPGEVQPVDGLSDNPGPDAAGNFLPLAVDLIDEIDVEMAIDQAIDRFGRLDVVVNNAGYRLAGEAKPAGTDGQRSWTLEEARENFYLNVFGSLNVIQQALPHLREQHSGHIVNLSSIPGFLGSMAEEEAASGIRVTHYSSLSSCNRTAGAAAVLRLVEGTPILLPAGVS